MIGIAGISLSLRGAQRRSNLLPDEPRYVRQAGDCFGAARLAMTGLAGFSTYRQNAPLIPAQAEAHAPWVPACRGMTRYKLQIEAALATRLPPRD